MNKITQALSSRTVWTVIAMFIIGGVNALFPVIPADWQAPLMGVLTLLAAYFHVNPKTQA